METKKDTDEMQCMNGQNEINTHSLHQPSPKSLLEP